MSSPVPVAANTGPSFEGAPVSRGLIFVVCACSLLAAATSKQYYFDVPLYPHILRDHQFWRAATHHFVFGNSSEVFIGAILLFWTAVPTERLFGSRKFASFVVTTLAMQTVLEMITLFLFSSFGFKRIPAGPFGIAIAIIYQNSRLIPASFHWVLFGIPITSRIALYILATQLVISQPPSSLVVSFIGLFVSYLYRSDFVHVKSYRISNRTAHFSSTLFHFLEGADAPIPQRGTAALYIERLPTSSVMRIPATFRATVTATPTPAGRLPAPTPTSTVAAAGVTQGPARPTQPPTVGFVQQWTAGITGERQQPTTAQVQELQNIFPHRPRGDIVAALTTSNLDTTIAAESLIDPAS